MDAWTHSVHYKAMAALVLSCIYHVFYHPLSSPVISTISYTIITITIPHSHILTMIYLSMIYIHIHIYHFFRPRIPPKVPVPSATGVVLRDLHTPLPSIPPSTLPSIPPSTPLFRPLLLPPSTPLFRPLLLLLLQVSICYVILKSLLFLWLVGVELHTEWLISKPWSLSTIHPILSTSQYKYHTTEIRINKIP